MEPVNGGGAASFGSGPANLFGGRRKTYPEHLKPVILKPVGGMSILGELDLPGVVPGCFLGRPFCASKQGLQAPGSELLGQSLGIPWTEKWPKTGYADDWVYCD